MKNQSISITLKNIRQQFSSEHCIIKNFSYHFNSCNAYGIIGKNGCGKSTLMKIIAGYYLPTYGRVIYHHNEKIVDQEQFFQYLMITAPDLWLIEELNIFDLLTFHFQFKKSNIPQYSIKDLVSWLEMDAHANKPIHSLSSGLKQKLKLGLCFLTDVPVLLLDEPTVYLDEKNVEWYDKNIQKIAKKKLVFVFSNNSKEYQHCNKIISIN